MMELEGLTSKKYTLNRNEIYVRQGRKFNDEGMEGTAARKGCYTSRTALENFQDILLNEYEIVNYEAYSWDKYLK